MDDELLEQFLVEGRDLLTRAAEELDALQAAPDRPDRLDGLFRTLHTLKGSTAVFDLAVLTALLHAAETALESARRTGSIQASLTAALIRVLDLCETWVDGLERGETPSRRLLEQTRAAEAALAGTATQVTDADPDLGENGAPEWAQRLANASAIPGAATAIRYVPAPDVYFRGDDPLAILRAVPDLVALEAVATRADPQTLYDPFHCTLQFEALSTAPPEAVRAALRLVFDQVELAVVEADAAVGTSELVLRSLRVDAEQLDALAALVDALVIAKNGLLQGDDRNRADAEAVLERVVSSVRAAVTDLRLSPLAPLFARFPRQVREIAEGLGKTVEFATRGERTALDKSVIEGLYEPLLHLLRNALDHGLETPEDRVRAGKPERGRLTLSAETHGSEVAIVLEDDGRGVDVGRVRDLAVQRGVVGADQARALSDAQAAELIFAPGFSTAANVSALSGRGVGMDAVRVAMERMGGRVSLRNRPGAGLSVTLSLPAHVVLTKALVIGAGGDRFGAALSTIGEIHRVRRDEVTAIRAVRAYVRRDRVIPLLRLGDLLGVAPAEDPPAFPVLTVQTPEGAVGLQVDTVGEQIEAPLRPTGGLLTNMPGLLGTILQGDGQVLLVLDLEALAA